MPPVSIRDLEEQPRVFRDLTADDIRGIQAAYYTSLSFVDAQIGRLLRASTRADWAATPWSSS